MYVHLQMRCNLGHNKGDVIWVTNLAKHTLIEHIHRRWDSSWGVEIACPLCRSLISLEVVGDHLRRSHSEPCRWACDQCGDSFHDDNAAAKHCLTTDHDGEQLVRSGGPDLPELVRKAQSASRTPFSMDSRFTPRPIQSQPQPASRRPFSPSIDRHFSPGPDKIRVSPSSQFSEEEFRSPARPPKLDFHETFRSAPTLSPEIISYRPPSHTSQYQTSSNPERHSPELALKEDSIGSESEWTETTRSSIFTDDISVSSMLEDQSSKFDSPTSSMLEDQSSTFESKKTEKVTCELCQCKVGKVENGQLNTRHSFCWECPVCGDTLAHKRTLIAHMKRSHKVWTKPPIFRGDARVAKAEVQACFPFVHRLTSDSKWSAFIDRYYQ